MAEFYIYRVVINSVINLVTSRLSKIALCMWHRAMLLRRSWPHDICESRVCLQAMQTAEASVCGHGRPQVWARAGTCPSCPPHTPGKFEKCYRVKEHLRSQFERSTGFESQPFWPRLIIYPPLEKPNGAHVCGSKGSRIHQQQSHQCFSGGKH